jgi:hypothetical protein
MAFGNASPEEIIKWMENGLFDLTNPACIVLFGGIVTRWQATEIFQRRYFKKVDSRIVEAFADNPYKFHKRWGTGYEINIRSDHIQFFISILPESVKRTHGFVG